MTRERKSPLRLGPAPAKDPDAPAKPRSAKPRPKRKAKPAAAKSTSLPAVIEPTQPLAGFDQFAAQDYAVAVPGSGKNGETRYLTVSPLRAIMAEQDGATEHVVTERTRQGVLYAAGLGIERKVIARILGTDMETLERCYGTELETAVHLMMNDVQTNLYNIARDPSHSQAVRSGVFLLGKLGNTLYRDQNRAESLAINPQTRTVDPALLDDDQREALRNILMSAMSLAAPRGQMVEGEYDEIDDAGDVL